MKYEKRGTWQTFPEYVEAKTGKPFARLDQYRDLYRIRGLDEAAEMLIRAVRARRHIEVHTDFDNDGCGCAAEFLLLLRAMGARNYRVYVPRRFTDRYGVRPWHVDEMPEGSLLITADNGISALTALSHAKERGMDVLVLDHHEAGKSLPKADILIDPAALPDGNDFTAYCGAGLTWRLTNRIIRDQAFAMRTAAIAAIATVADSVDLKEENRRIVQMGIWSMEHGMAGAGIEEVLKAAKTSFPITGETLSFRICPMFAAAGRLYDKGSHFSTAVFLEEDRARAVALAAQMKAVNQIRKEITKQAVAKIRTEEHVPLQFLRTDHIHPGLLGIAASKISEQTGMPAFLYRVENGIATGSARSDDEHQNDVAKILAFADDLLTEYGGHPGAAGFSFQAGNEKAVKERLLSCPVMPHTKEAFYDLELHPQDAENTRRLMDLAEPFGHGMEEPVLRMECLVPEAGCYRPMGDGSHVSLMLPGGLKAVGFSMMEQVKSMGFPEHIALYGHLNRNYFRGNMTLSFRFDGAEGL